jgi:hypothetical protein
MKVLVDVGFAVGIALGFAPWAHAARLTTSGAEASTTYPPEGSNSYEATRVTDGKVSTSWIEGADGSGLGQWVRVTLPASTTVQKIKIWGGIWYSHTEWSRANRPRQIEVRWSDGSTDTFEMRDEMVAQEFALPTARTTTTAEIRIKSVYDGSAWFDTGISEIQLFDAAAGVEKVAREVVASTTLPADGDGNYDPANTQDGVNDTMWCEGSSGDGANEWIEARFTGAQSVSKMHVVSGIGSSLALWMKANRATAATLTFSDGATETIAIRPTVMPQVIEFPAHTTSSVKVTFTTVVAGREYNDLCVSEARFE